MNRKGSHPQKPVKPKSKFIIRLKKMSDRLRLKRMRDKIDTTYNQDTNMFI